MTTSSINFQDISFEDLEALINGGDIQLIDVREPSEIKSSGKIGQAINIPCEHPVGSMTKLAVFLFFHKAERLASETRLC